MKVILTGGLGNQLFQLNAALDLYSGEIKLVSNIGAPRVDSTGRPEIQGLQLPSRVKFISPKIAAPKIASKVFGLNLRAHFSPGRFEKYFLKLYRILGSLYFSIIFREYTVIRASTDVGYSEISKAKEHDLLLGYFQSYKYLSHKSKTELRSLVPDSPSSDFVKLKESLLGLRLLVIHIRLGDYFNEPGIGILSPSYYATALTKLDLTNFDKILVFTDTPEKVKNYLPKSFNHEFEIVSNNLTSVETISIMSLGSEYIISNSTFSWWGASMSVNERAIVMAPSPWFEKIKSPKALVPPAWHLLDR